MSHNIFSKESNFYFEKIISSNTFNITLSPEIQRQYLLNIIKVEPLLRKCNINGQF